MPSRLESALAVLDTDRDGHIDAVEWEEAIETALSNKLEQRAAARVLESKAAAKEIEEFTDEFKSAAARCFQLIDKDGGGTLSKAEIVKAVASDKEVIKFLNNSGEENLQFLLQPKRIEHALDILDTDKSGELDIDEWVRSSDMRLLGGRRGGVAGVVIITTLTLSVPRRRRRSTAGSRSAWSRWPRSASAAGAPRAPRTRPSRPNS